MPKKRRAVAQRRSAKTHPGPAACPFGFRDAPVGVQPDDLSCVDLGGANLGGANFRRQPGLPLSELLRPVRRRPERRQPERRQPDRRRPVRSRPDRRQPDRRQPDRRRPVRSRPDDANLSDADLTDANLTDANPFDAIVAGAKRDGVIWSPLDCLIGQSTAEYCRP